MTPQRVGVLVAIAVGALIAAQAAQAEPFLPERADPGGALERSESVWHDERMATGIGIGLQVGGGITGFIDPAMRATTSEIGGMWAARLALGTHVPLGVEIGYMGSATPIDAELGRADALMIGTTLEGVLRYNIVPRARWTPYAFAGLGWQRYTIDDDAFQLADVGIGNRDDLLVVPLGVGVVYRFGPLVADLRGTFRAARGEDLVLETPSASLATAVGTFAPMHTWDASLNVGYEL